MYKYINYIHLNNIQWFNLAKVTQDDNMYLYRVPVTFPKLLITPVTNSNDTYYYFTIIYKLYYWFSISINLTIYFQ